MFLNDDIPQPAGVILAGKIDSEMRSPAFRPLERGPHRKNLGQCIASQPVGAMRARRHFADRNKGCNPTLHQAGLSAKTNLNHKVFN